MFMRGQRSNVGTREALLEIASSSSRVEGGNFRRCCWPVAKLAAPLLAYAATTQTYVHSIKSNAPSAPEVLQMVIDPPLIESSLELQTSTPRGVQARCVTQNDISVFIGVATCMRKCGKQRRENSGWTRRRLGERR
jgi:hypothetical protein